MSILKEHDMEKNCEAAEAVNTVRAHYVPECFMCAQSDRRCHCTVKRF